METPDALNSKLLKLFTRGSLVIISLFFVLYCGVTAFLLYFCNKNQNNDIALILLLTIIPLLLFLTLFLIFSCLVKSYFESICIKNEEYFFRMHKIKVMGEVCLTLAKDIKIDSCRNLEAAQKFLRENLGSFLKADS